ncbi:MAG: cell division protein FtsB [Brachymonas sp.]|nr:cell division protein FtsB [Brachymonas sp.]
MTINRVVFVVLLVLMGVVHTQLWLGRGGVPAVNKLRGQLTAQNQSNHMLRQQNEQLGSEVEDLKLGLETVEEKARYEMGMVKPNEIYVQVMPAAVPAH